MSILGKLFGRKKPAQEEPETEISKPLTAADRKQLNLEIEEKKAYRDFLKEVEELEKRHGMNTPIKWEEVKAIQGRLANRCEPIERVLQGMPEQKNTVYWEEKMKLLNPIMDQMVEMESRAVQTNIKIAQNFAKFNAVYTEDASLSKGVNSKKELLFDLLGKNPGVAVGDNHNENTTLQFLRNNLKDLKKSGVNTVYIEYDPPSFKQWSCLSAPQLEKLAYKGSLDFSELSDEQRRGFSPDTKMTSGKLVLPTRVIGAADDYFKEYMLFFAEAKRCGVDIVNIDARQVSCDYQSSSKTRISFTNFEWADFIKNDLKNREGKYILFGGASHFAARSGDCIGLVDEALGIPAISFDRALTSLGFKAAPAISGLDYILRAGLNYGDMLFCKEGDLQGLNPTEIKNGQAKQPEK